MDTRHLREGDRVEVGSLWAVRPVPRHPGVVATGVRDHNGGRLSGDAANGLESAEMVDRGWIDGLGNVADPTFKSVSQGAATGLWAATSPQLAALGGPYLEDCDVAGPAADDGTGVKTYAVDRQEAASLWDLRVSLTGRDLL